MKKTLMTAVLAMLSMVSVATTNDYDNVDVYDVKITAKTPYISGGVRQYRTDSFNGQLMIYLMEDGTVVDAECTLTQKKAKKTRDFEVVFDVSTVVGKKWNTPTTFFTLEAEDLKFFCAAEGSFKTIKKAGCTPCGEATTSCKKPSFSGNVAGVYDCECGAVSPTRVLGACGETEDTDTLAAINGSISIKYNKKASK